MKSSAITIYVERKCGDDPSQPLKKQKPYTRQKKKRILCTAAASTCGKYTAVPRSYIYIKKKKLLRYAVSHTRNEVYARGTVQATSASLRDGARCSEE